MNTLNFSPNYTMEKLLEQVVHVDDYPVLLEHTNLKEVLETLPLSEGLKIQLSNFLKAHTALEKKRHTKKLNSAEDNQEKAKELTILYYIFHKFIASREIRIKEINSREYQETIEIKKELFIGGIPRLLICVDGRVLSKLFAGLSGHAMRLPAGAHIDFKPDQENGGVFLDPKGEVAQMIDNVLQEQNILTECFDSHCGCAARCLHAEKCSHTTLDDKGLLEDVREKRAMIQATQAYIQARFKGTKEFIGIQTSFDPHNGYMYMGLENYADNPKVAQEGFSNSNLAALLLDKHIISTKELANNSLKNVFQNNYFELNYEKDYVSSSVQFWRNIKAMCASALPIIIPRLQNLYPYLQDEKYIKELTQRALVLLANAYSGYLLNHDTSGNEVPYKYAKHTENIIAVTKAERGPFAHAPSFSIHPGDPNTDEHVDLAEGIVRSNRKNKNFSDGEKVAVETLYADTPETYIHNGVPLVFFQRLDQLPSQDIINQLQKTDWAEISEMNWMNMTETEIKDYLTTKLPSIPMREGREIFQTITNMWKKAQEFLTPGYKATESILAGKLVPMWILSGPHRETIVIFPFIAKGYKRTTVTPFTVE